MWSWPLNIKILLMLIVLLLVLSWACAFCSAKKSSSSGGVGKSAGAGAVTSVSITIWSYSHYKVTVLVLDGIPSSSQQDLYKIELYNIELILDVSSILACQFQCPWKLILIKNYGSFKGFNIEYNCPKYRNIFLTCLSNVNCFTSASRLVTKESSKVTL